METFLAYWFGGLGLVVVVYVAAVTWAIWRRFEAIKRGAVDE